MDKFINQALLKPLELLGHQVLNVLPNVLAMGIILLGGLFVVLSIALAAYGDAKIKFDPMPPMRLAAPFGHSRPREIGLSG